VKDPLLVSFSPLSLIVRRQLLNGWLSACIFQISNNLPGARHFFLYQSSVVLHHQSDVYVCIHAHAHTGHQHTHRQTANTANAVQ